MRAVFELLPNILEVNTASSELFIEISCSGLSYAILDKKQNLFTGVALYHFEKENYPDEIATEVKEAFYSHSIANIEFTDITVIYALNELVLIPSKYNKRQPVKELELLFGDVNETEHFSEEIHGKEIINRYRVPTSIYNVVKEQFPASRQFQQTSLLLQSGTLQNDEIRLIFHPGQMSILAHKGSKLVYAGDQTFNSKEDAIWNILNALDKLNIEDPLIRVGGMIELNSPLFLELRKYFKHIHPDELDAHVQYDQSIMDLPNHYFSYLFSSALCAL